MYIVELIYPGTWLNLDDCDKAWETMNLIDNMESQLIDAAISLTFFEQERENWGNQFESEKFRKEWELDRSLHAETEQQYRKELGMEKLLRNYENLQQRIEAEAKRKKWQSGQLPRSYKHRLPSIYAHSFLYALDGFSKCLNVVASEPGLPSSIYKIQEELDQTLPSLKKIRNSALHIEDRIRGYGTPDQVKKGRKMTLQPIQNEMINAPGGGVLALSNLNGSKLGYTVDNGNYQELEISSNTLSIAVNTLQQLINAFSWSGPARYKPDY